MVKRLSLFFFFNTLIHLAVPSLSCNMGPSMFLMSCRIFIVDCGIY